MTPKNESNIPSQLASWNQRGMLGKMKSALHLEKMATFGPGMPCVFQGEQATVIGLAGSDQRLIQTPSGRQIAVSVDDLEPIAKPFAGAEGAQSR